MGEGRRRGDAIRGPRDAFPDMHSVHWAAAMTGFFRETMIRHAVLSGTITAISVDVHGATTRSCLIASPSFPLSVAAGFLRAGSDAVDLASITLPTDNVMTRERPCWSSQVKIIAAVASRAVASRA